MNMVRLLSVWPQLCPNQDSLSSWNQTRCPATFTCAPNDFSVTKWGCSPFSNATICNEYQTCPSNTNCILLSGSGYNAVYNCVSKPVTSTSSPLTVATSLCTCKPGVPLPLDPLRKNVVIIGDSLSIGYTPLVQAELEDIASVQHAPWDISDGGAEETAYGLQCLDLWLASPSGMSIAPDLIWFNFGMHDYVPSCQPGQGCVPGQSGNTSVYPSELTSIGKKIASFANSLPSPAKVIFALTTPFLCDSSIDTTIEHTLNQNASGIMKQLGIQVVDLHQPIVDKCGVAPVQSCFNISGCFCPHCPGAGYQYLVNSTIAPAIRAALKG